MEIKRRLQLPELMRHFGLPMIAVEIGVCGAANATDLLKAGIEKIYLIDAWRTLNTVGDGGYDQEWHDKNYRLTLELLSKFDSDRYVILRGESDKMHVHIPDNSLGLVYLDGNHTYDGVKSDIENYFPKLVAGGVMGFHDYVNMSGVRVAVNNFARENNLTVHGIPETSAGDAGAWFRKNV